MSKTFYRDKFIKYANINNTYKMSKYINKYIVNGGGSYEDLLARLHIENAHTRTYCADTSFSNHTGECWHDSLTMIFCYTDHIKEMVQKKLLNLRPIEIINLAVENRIQYLAPCFRNPTFFLQLEKYLMLLQNRFCAHTRILSEEGKLVDTRMCTRRSSTETDSEYHSKHDYPIDIMRRRNSYVAGVHTSKIAQTLIHAEPHIDYESDDDTDKYRDSFFTGHTEVPKIFGQDVTLATGENIYASYIWCHVLSFCLLDGDMNVVLKHITRSEIDDANTFELIESLAVLINSERHSMAIYKCNDRDIFYNDNYDNQIIDEYKDDKDEKHHEPKATEKSLKIFVNRNLIFNLINLRPPINFYSSRIEHLNPILYNHITKETYDANFGYIDHPVYDDKKYIKAIIFTTISLRYIPIPNKNEYIIYVFALSHINNKAEFGDIELDILTKKYANDIIVNILIAEMSHDVKLLLFNQFIQKNNKFEIDKLWHNIIIKNDKSMADILLLSNLSPYDVFIGLHSENIFIKKILDDKTRYLELHSKYSVYDIVSIQFLKKMYLCGYMAKVIEEISTNLQKESSFIENYGDFLCRAIFGLYLDNNDNFPIIQNSIKLCRDYLAGAPYVKRLVSILTSEQDDATSGRIRS